MKRDGVTMNDIDVWTWLVLTAVAGFCFIVITALMEAPI